MGDIQRRRQRKRVRFSGLSGGNIYSFMPCLRSRPASALFIDVLINAQRAPVSPEDRAGGSSRPPASLPVGLAQRWAFWGGCLTSPHFLLAVKSPCRGVPWGCVCREHLTPALLVMGTEGALCPRGSRHNGAPCRRPAPSPRGRPRPHRATAGCGDARSWGFSLGNLFSLLVWPD